MAAGTEFSERNICTKLITPALNTAGWDVQTQIREEISFTNGHTPDDDWIVKEVREHWHASKQRFTPNELQTRLGWTCQNDVVPPTSPQF
ncbi:hypothetical protein ABFU65_06675 [Xanthomonas campestris pv. raphani]|uniref:hypothetical protein n=1 Tax=Xanthomonas campestris TaxID=339 RepID=UPI002B2394D8|nr:hypothetical protein [Xanthomonas campestris]MEA9656061.1 hypothetical protein [Xanthomonas campestris pv. raphani]